jgi:hypothetical protein
MEAHAHTLYVVLQGEFALYRERTNNPEHDTLHIVAPGFGDDNPHAYKAGPWGSHWKNPKYDLRNTPLHLHHAFGDRKQGMDPKMVRHHPRAIPERNTDLFMSCGPETPDPSGALVHITAPIPLAILSGLAETTQSATITFTPQNGNPITRLAPSHAAVILILMYGWHGERPYLSDASGKHRWDTGGPDDFQSIQIYASSPDESYETPQHAKDAFKAAAKLLGEDACIDWPGTAAFHRLAATPPPGLKWAQVNLFLSEVMQLEGVPILEEDFVDLRNAKFPFPWEPLTKGGQSTNCGPVTGDDDGGDND